VKGVLRVKNKKNPGFIAVLIIISLAMAGCGGSSTEAPKTAPAAQTATAAVADKQPLLAAKPSEWKADGVISDNEYSKYQKIGEVEVYSRIDGDVVRIALKAKTNGYVAIGIDPSVSMKDADIVIGGMKDGKAFISNDFGTVARGPHPTKESQGSKTNITAYGGSRKDGFTIIEFERKLAPGGNVDKALKMGENKIIWAIGDSDDLTAKHSKRGSGTLNL